MKLRKTRVNHRPLTAINCFCAYPMGDDLTDLTDITPTDDVTADDGTGYTGTYTVPASTPTSATPTSSTGFLAGLGNVFSTLLTNGVTAGGAAATNLIAGTGNTVKPATSPAATAAKPANTAAKPAATAASSSNTTLLLIGAAVLGIILISRKK